MTEVSTSSAVADAAMPVNEVSSVLPRTSTAVAAPDPSGGEPVGVETVVDETAGEGAMIDRVVDTSAVGETGPDVAIDETAVDEIAVDEIAVDEIAIDPSGVGEAVADIAADGVAVDGTVLNDPVLDEAVLDDPVLDGAASGEPAAGAETVFGEIAPGAAMATPTDTKGSAPGRRGLPGRWIVGGAVGAAVVVVAAMLLWRGDDRQAVAPARAPADAASDVAPPPVIRRSAPMPSPQGAVDLDLTLDVGRSILSDQVFPLYPDTIGEIVVAWAPTGDADRAPDVTPAVDILAPAGTPFVAPVHGVIHLVSPTDRWDPEDDHPIRRDGLAVWLRGDDGLQYYGGYLASIAPGIEPGVTVRAGTMLGTVGASGQAAGGPPRLRFAISRKAQGEDLDPFPFLSAWAAGYDTASPDDGPYVFPVIGRLAGQIRSIRGSGEAQLTVAAGSPVLAATAGEVVDIRYENTWRPQEITFGEPEPELAASPVLDADGQAVLDAEGTPVTTMIPTGNTLPPVTIPPVPNAPGSERGLMVTIIGDDGFRYEFSRLGSIAGGLRIGNRVEVESRIGTAGRSGDAHGTTGRLHVRIEGAAGAAERNPVIDPGAPLDARAVLSLWRQGHGVAPDVALGLRGSDGFSTYVVPARPLHDVSFGPGGHTYPATDLFALRGTEAVAPADGVVGAVSWNDFWDPVTETGGKGGRYLYLHGDDGFRYYGSHYDTIEDGIEPGVRLAKGQRIGTVGRTGNARLTPPHIHFEISRIDDWAVVRGQLDPVPALEAWRAGEVWAPS